MTDSGTIIDLADVKRKSTTSTAVSQNNPTSTSYGSNTRETQSSYSLPPQPIQTGSGGGWQNIAVWTVFGLLITWLGTLTYLFHTESKDIRKTISDNQLMLVEKMHELQVEINKNNYELERTISNNIATSVNSLREDFRSGITKSGKGP